MIYSGIDWSGDAGDPRKSALSPILVIALAQVSGSDLGSLSRTLEIIRRRQSLSPDFTFKYSGCSEKVRQAFFSEISSVHAFVYMARIDKREWYGSSPQGRPNDRLDQAIADLVCRAPQATIAGQVLLIDRPKAETRAVRRTEAVIKRALKGAQVQPYPQVKPCPDHRLQGEIVQVADTFAGALHRQGAGGDHLRQVSRMFVVV